MQRRVDETNKNFVDFSRGIGSQYKTPVTELVNGLKVFYIQ